MKDLCTYQVRLESKVDQEEINGSSPVETIVEQSDPDSTLLTVQIDQSGLLGLLRYLHGKGFRFLSVNRTR